MPDKYAPKCTNYNMLVSAIVTTYKREAWIVERAVRSIINQTYKNIEIIVVDDSPDDYPSRAEVKKTIEKLDSDEIHIKYIMHPENKGACAARNTGLAESRGDIIGYLDDDDEWLPKKVEAMIEGFQDNDVGLVYADNILKFDDTGRERVVNRPKHSGMVYDKLILENFIGSTSFPLIGRECLVDIGGFDELMQSAQDADVYLRLSNKYKIAYVDEVVAIYHLHKNERVSSNVDRKISGMERINEKNSEYLMSNSEAYWIRNMKLVTYYAKKGDRKKSYSIWKECVKKKPLKLFGNIKWLFRIVMMSF